MTSLLPSNRVRAQRALLALAPFHNDGGEFDLETNIQDLLTDLRHLAKASDLHLEDIFSRSEGNFEAECEGLDETEGTSPQVLEMDKALPLLKMMNPESRKNPLLQDVLEQATNTSSRFTVIALDQASAIKFHHVTAFGPAQALFEASKLGYGSLVAALPGELEIPGNRLEESSPGFIFLAPQGVMSMSRYYRLYVQERERIARDRGELGHG
jgi:hypothetical protein